MKKDNLKGALKDIDRLRKLGELSTEDSYRVSEQPKLVSSFYDAVTSLYEFGWGSTFHFSPRRPGENLKSSQRRQDHEIAKLLALGPGMEVADVGCGVGGPLVNIATSTGSRIVGINFNRHQIQRGTERVRRAGLSETCSFLYADYMKVPLKEDTFDALYSIEAICHAPNR
ncbi:MAG: class I SAM-dependent methyltransferase [Gammaproteobacteria bacterium]|nr:class I SAM-dependent methyltransferase [Gammaproteobacteria bacterium]